ncbi:hypothetical protein VCHENC02_4951A, partial [Vibrio harveyi]
MILELIKLKEESLVYDEAFCLS